MIDIVAKWKSIGIAFGLKSGKLNEIESSHPRDAAECLNDVLINWLNKNYNFKKFGNPTWKKVVDVIADPAGGANPSHASFVASKHQSKFQ